MPQLRLFATIVAAGAIGIGISACAEQSSTCSAAGGRVGDTWADLGVGETNFAALNDGDSVPIVLGPQGGFMIALALKASGTTPGDAYDPSDPDNPRITYRATQPDTGEVLGTITQIRGLKDSDARTDGSASGVFELAGTWMVFNPAIDTGDYFDREILIDLVLVDSCGYESTDAALATALAPEM